MIVVLGLSHRTAPIEVREHAAMPGELLGEVLAELVAQPNVGEALIVSTCNRVEIVAAGRDSSVEVLPLVLDELEAVLLKRAPMVRNYLYRHAGNDAVVHLFRVASSLDSLVLGEPQILGQVKTGFEQAKQNGTVGSHLNRVVAHALRTAKRVRNETAIGQGQVSVPSVAIDLARQIFGELKGRRVALIGSGQMGESVAKLLGQAGAELVVLGRNSERVAALAIQMNAVPRDLASQLKQTLSEVDVVVTATSASGYVVDEDAVAQVRKQRKGRSLFFIDLAVPRDVDPRIGDIDNTFLYNVDDLSQIVAETLSSREVEGERAEAIVRDEASNHERALSAEQVTPTLVALRKQFSGVLVAELQKSLRTRLKHLADDDREALNVMLDSALNKAFHPLTRRLRTLASSERAQADSDLHLSVLAALFELDVHAQSRASLSPAALKSSNQPSLPEAAPLDPVASNDPNDSKKKVS